MFNFLNFFKELGSGEGFAPPQIIVIELHIKEMHFKNVYHWAHRLYKKIFNNLKLWTDRTSLLHLCKPALPIPVSVCKN